MHATALKPPGPCCLSLDLKAALQQEKPGLHQKVLAHHQGSRLTQHLKSGSSAVRAAAVAPPKECLQISSTTSSGESVATSKECLQISSTTSSGEPKPLAKQSAPRSSQ